MDVFTCLKRRRSVRGYNPDRAVEPEKIARILEAARRAPSWANRQGTRLIVVDDPVALPSVFARRGGEWGARLFLVAVAEPTRSGEADGKPYYLVDAAIALDHAVLAATALGLATCWTAGSLLDEAAIKRELGIPDPWRVVALTPLGYPRDPAPAEPSPRIPLPDFARKNRFDRPFATDPDPDPPS